MEELYTYNVPEHYLSDTECIPDFQSLYCFVFFPGEEIDSLQKSHGFNLQKLKNSELRLTDAKQKMRELALNIKMKEELIKELVRTGNWLLQGKSEYRNRRKGIKLVKSHVLHFYVMQEHF